MDAAAAEVVAAAESVVESASTQQAALALTFTRAGMSLVTAGAIVSQGGRPDPETAARLASTLEHLAGVLRAE